MCPIIIPILNNRDRKSGYSIADNASDIFSIKSPFVFFSETDCKDNTFLFLSPNIWGLFFQVFFRHAEKRHCGML